MPKKNNGKRSKTNKKENISKEYNVKNKKPNAKTKKIVKRILITILLLILILAGVAFGVLYGVVKEAKISVSDMALKNENSIILDNAGNTVAILSGDENRSFVSISEMAEYLPVAFVSIEDERFYEHMGVDVKRTIGATVKYALSKIGIGSSSYGGSTITQQVIKNSTQEKDRTWQRKVKEIARAYYIEKELSKDQILELYLNLIYMGGNTNIYGVEVASNYYFSKSAKDLDLAECAFLAGINNTPNSYDPFIEDNTKNLEKIKTRTKTVLNKMNELGKIKTKEEYDAAIAKVDAGLTFNKGTVSQNIYSYHTDAAIMQIVNQLMEEKDLNRNAAELYLYSGGFTIYTTQDTNLQNIMQSEFEKDKYLVSGRDKKKDGTLVNEHSEAGMTLIDYKTGYVLATCGGLGEKTTSLGYNRGTQLVKQTGSSMKPLAVVAPGIDQGIITAATVFDDVPTSFGRYTPKNYNYYRGLLTVRHAIESSQNIPMVKGIQKIGTKNSLEFLKTLGISGLDDEKDDNLQLSLGGLTKGTNPLEMAAAYGAIANDGVYITPTFYTKVVDGDGNIVLEPKQESRTVMSSSAAYVVKEVLTQPVKSGTATNCSISGMSVAAKTGTTNNDYDRWLCGFTPYYAAATWYGFDDNETVRGWGTSPASQIWASVMKQAHSGLKGKYFSATRPSNVVTAKICKDSGLIATDVCKEDPREDRTYTEYFVKGTVPTKTCECHVKVDICKETGLLANEFCTEKESKVFITRPDYETNTSWKKAKDAEYMLTIKDSCTVHKETPDTTKPVIKLNGEETITIKLNDTYKDAGATATDDKDGDITNKIVITGKVDTSKAGTYIITYTVEDLAKNVAIAKRTVIVKANQVEPEPQPEPEPEPEPTPTPTPEPNPEPQPDQNETVNNTGVN
ncbi:MAG: transglycosylase domain-containing protein [Clostridia bacterium]|nr:transglycosylase domain-containing protein [Clostridia bacterium]